MVQRRNVLEYLFRLILDQNRLSMRQVLANWSLGHWLITFFPAGAMLIAIAIAGWIFGIDIGLLTNDPAAIGRIHPLSGFLSNLGVLLWSGAACVCLFTASVAYRHKAFEVFAFTMSSGLLSGYLLFDDLFLLHEYLVPSYLQLSEIWVYGFTGVATLTYIIRFRLLILLRSDFVLLALGLGCLALSVIADTVMLNLLRRLDQWLFFIEDGFKWIGIVCWFSYHLRTCYRFIVEPERFAPSAERRFLD